MKIEFIVMLGIQLITAGIFIGGQDKAIKFLEKQIAQNKTDIKESFESHKTDIKEQFKRLEEKQDKHNNLIERMCCVEQSCKSAHHRLDDYFNKKD